MNFDGYQWISMDFMDFEDFIVPSELIETDGMVQTTHRAMSFRIIGFRARDIVCDGNEPEVTRETPQAGYVDQTAPNNRIDAI